MVVVKLQHRIHLMQTSQVTSVNGDGGFRFGGSDVGYEGEVRTKESGSLWDNEW
jgi:hypothetical protein